MGDYLLYPSQRFLRRAGPPAASKDRTGLLLGDPKPITEGTGRITDVAEYCRGDVLRTRAMFKRMTFSDLAVA